MPYRTVFDVTRWGYDPTFPLFGLMFVAMGCALLVGATRGFRHGIRLRGPRLTKWLPLAFATLWTLAAFTATYAPYRKAQQALLDGRAQVIEGNVANLVPGESARGGETFDVGDVHFTIHGNLHTPGFHETICQGSPLIDGLPVRIHYVGGEILKLEIDAAASAPSQPICHQPDFLKLLLIAPIMLVFLLPAVTFTLSRLGGWASLAGRFGVDALSGEVGFYMQSVRLSLFGAYNNCVNVCIGPDAVSLVPMIPFGLFHRPISIPMAAVADCRRRRMFLRWQTDIVLAEDSSVITFYGPAGDTVHHAWSLGKQDAVET